MFIKYILRVQSYQNHLNLVYGKVFVAILLLLISLLILRQAVTLRCHFCISYFNNTKLVPKLLILNFDKQLNFIASLSVFIQSLIDESS